MGMQTGIRPGTADFAGLIVNLAAEEEGIQVIVPLFVSLLDHQVQVFQGLVFGQFNLTPDLG
jgi:hypothetical protein